MPPGYRYYNILEVLVFVEEVSALNRYHGDVVSTTTPCYVPVIQAVLYALLSSLVCLLILFLMNFRGFSGVFRAAFMLIATLCDKLLASERV